MSFRLVPIVLLCAALAGCTQTRQLLNLDSEPELDTTVHKVAVMPIDRDPRALSDKMPPDAERIVTAHIYGALADSSHWRIVPDMTVAAALANISPVLTPEDRARELAAAVEADGVIFGTLSRFVEREGSDYGADKPTSVSFELKAFARKRDEVIWEGKFDETQEALTTNLLNFWQFWKGGPRWFTASEFIEMGVDRLIEDLEDRTP
jgi:hypothetical protein